jgi:hypothetical protein
MPFFSPDQISVNVIYRKEDYIKAGKGAQDENASNTIVKDGSFRKIVYNSNAYLIN